MLTFPNIAQPSYPLKSKWENPVLASKMENGTVVTRPKFTRLRETFTLSWTALPAADYATLREFWHTTLGGSAVFLWTYPQIVGDPLSGKEFRVRFSAEEPSFEVSAPGLYRGSVTLEEA